MLKISNFLNIFSPYALDFIISLLLYMNCGFFIAFSAKGSVLSAISPQYLCFYIALAFTILSILVKTKIKLSKSVILGLLTILYLLVSQFLFLHGRPIAILGACVSVMFYILGAYLLSRLRLKQLKFIADSAILFSLLLFVFDTLYKLVHYGFDVIYMFFHYRVKFSLLYPDSNTLGIQITFLFVLAYYLFKQTKQTWYLFVILAYLIAAFCTFSRAAVIAILLVFAFDLVFSSIKNLLKKQKVKYSKGNISVNKIGAILVTTLTIVFSIIMTTKIILYLLTDYSFGTKLLLFKDTINFLKTAPFEEILFGIGFNNGNISKYCYEGYAHAYLTTYIIESGLVGFTLFTTFLLRIFWECKKTVYVFVPFLIFAFSYFGHTHLHVFYSVLIIIYQMEKNMFYSKTEEVTRCNQPSL